MLSRSGASVREWLAEHSPNLVSKFEDEFHAALKDASATFDLGAADAVVRRWWLLVIGRSQSLTSAEHEQLDRARRGDLRGLTALDPTGAPRRLA